MKNYQIIIFIAIVLSIYSLANLYIFFKGLHSLPALRSSKVLYAVVFAVLAFVFIAGKLLEAWHSSVISDILNIAGGFWLAFMLYGFLFLLISDVVLILLRIPGIIHGEGIVQYKKWAFLLTLLVSFLLIAGGFVNSLIPRVKTYNIAIGKAAGIGQFRVAAVSDIHLGSEIRKRSMIKLSGILMKLKPDLVLLLGDIVDGEIGPVLRGDLLKYFSCPGCDFGLYAITGNHEFIGGAKRTIPYIESKGIRLLKDEIVTINGGIQIIGRLDRSSERFYGKPRAGLDELISKVDTTKPVILLDHQPFGLDQAAKYGVDLQLSGHTHNGQFWPLNHVVRWIYELSYGYMKKGKTQYIVSSGFGLWGPKIRSGSNSEVLLLNLTFNSPE